MEANKTNANAENCERWPLDLWLGASRGRAQISAAAQFADSGCTELARDAASEGVISLRLALSAYTASAEYRRYAEWVRSYARTLSDDLTNEPASFADAALRNAILGFASEVRDCLVFPSMVRDELAERIAAVASEGAGAVAAALGACAIAERALKSRRT